jgi:hypothetical protein
VLGSNVADRERLVQPSSDLSRRGIPLLLEQRDDVGTGNDDDGVNILSDLSVRLWRNVRGGDQDSEFPVAESGYEPAHILDADAVFKGFVKLGL